MTKRDHGTSRTPPGARRFSIRAAMWFMALLTMAGMTSVVVASAASAAASRAVAPRAASTTNLGYTSLPAPVRIADTRTGATDPSTYAGKTLGPGQSLTVDMPSSVPSGAGAIVAQLTAINPTLGGYLAAYPAGGTIPGTANVNFVAGQIVGNMVTVGLGTDASNGDPAVSIYNGPSGNTDFTLDLYGYYAPQTSSSGAAYVPITPTRIVDTRAGSGYAGAGQTLGAGDTLQIPITGSNGVPANASAVAVNIAVVNTTAQSYIQSYPTGSPPSSSTPTVNMNWLAGEVLSTKAIVGIGTGGDIDVYNAQGSTDVVIDLDGYFTAAGGTGSLFNTLSSPTRLEDTRPNAVAAGASLPVTVGGADGIPSTATAGVLNITDLANGPNYLTAYPAGQAVPTAADVNYTSGDTSSTVGNASYATIGTGGVVDIYDSTSSANIVVDAFGYFAPVTVSAYTVSPSTPQSAAVSTGYTASSSAISYTATGLGTTAVCVALFPSTGADAPVTTSSGTTFTPSSGNAAGIGTSNNTGNAEITTVNGAATGNVEKTSAPVTPSSGSITFTLNTAPTVAGTSGVDGTIPVVYAPTAGSCANLPVNSSGTPTVSYGVGGSATWTVSAQYTVSGPSPSGTPSVSTSTSTAGDVTYTVTGFTAANTPDGYVDVALFPSTGTNAPVTSSGATTFASSNGTGVAGPAKGEATTNSQTATSVASPDQGGACVTGSSCYGYIASINGVPTAAAPDLVKSVAVTTGGTLTFVVNSFEPDGTIPVVFTEPAVTATGTLQLGTSGQPATGYTYGTGASTTWSVSAPSAAAGTFTDWVVNSVNNPGGTFVACANGTITCFTFTDTASGDSYNYLDIGGSAGGISEAQFQSFLSGPVTQTNSLPSPVLGDELNITYNPSGPSTFAFSNGVTASACSSCTISGTPTAPSGQGDVPGAPTSVASSVSTTPSGEGLAWTAPPNLDVTSDTTALYNVYVAPVTSGTVGAYTKAGTITNASTPVLTSSGGFTLTNCATASPTCVVITGGLTAGDTYSVVVSAKSGTGDSNVAEEGQASAATQFTVSTTPAASLAPLSISTGVVPASGTATTLLSGTSLTVVFNGTVSFAPSSFSLTVVDASGNEATISNSDATGTLTSSAGGTNNTVQYTLTSSPVVVHGSAPSLADLEVLSQTGVSNTVGPWNVAGSGASNLTGVTRVFDGANSAISTPTEPTVAPVTASTSSLSVTTCTGSDTVNVYTENGSSLGSVACSSGAATVTLSTSVTPTTTLLVTQSAAVGAFGYESLATVTAGMAPNPIAATGSLTPLGGTVTVTLTTLPGATVYLSFASTALALGQGAKVGSTALTSTPAAFTATSAGQIVITYTAGTGLTGVDTITASNASSSPTFTATDTYTY